jgi:hypothetical protein
VLRLFWNGDDVPVLHHQLS